MIKKLRSEEKTETSISRQLYLPGPPAKTTEDGLGFRISDLAVCSTFMRDLKKRSNSAVCISSKFSRIVLVVGILLESSCMFMSFHNEFWYNKFKFSLKSSEMNIFSICYSFKKKIYNKLSQSRENLSKPLVSIGK